MMRKNNMESLINQLNDEKGSTKSFWNTLEKISGNAQQDNIDEETTNLNKFRS